MAASFFPTIIDGYQINCSSICFDKLVLCILLNMSIEMFRVAYIGFVCPSLYIILGVVPPYSIS